MLESFKYSGKKTKLLGFYRPIPKFCQRVIEPYLGSGSFLLNTQLPGVGIELNQDLFECWKWLQRVTPQELVDLNEYVKNSIKKTPKQSIRNFKLEKGPETYVRVNISGLVTGQLSSWITYPQHKLPIQKTIQALPRIRNLQIIHGKAENFSDFQKTDLVFLDPPYIGTTANYVQKGVSANFDNEYNPQTTIDLISRLTCPVILTYGTNAKEIFPDYPWEVVATKKVPNMRRGGTVDRIEYVSYLNFPQRAINVLE